MFGGGARAIWIDAQGRDLLPALEPLFARPPTDCTIVVKAGQLKKGTGLRAAFESSAARASIECFSDDANALESLIGAEARAAGLAIAPDARAALVDMVGADRRTTRGEIAKLMLYARGRPQITVEDVEAIVSDAAPSNLDQVIDHALLGDLPAVEAPLARFFHEGGEADYLMIRLVARLTLLHRLRVEMDQGRPFDAACQALFVKLPMSARRALAKQAERWTTDSIAHRLPAVRLASARVRIESELADVLATRALWALAARGRGARR
jgi:DNA polymerase-3 subunit delta